MRRLLIVAILFFITACSTKPSESAIQTAIAQTKALWTSIPTNTAYPTHTPNNTFTPWVVTELVIPTFTVTPLFTPTITDTALPPTETPNLTQTSEAQVLALLRSDKGNGFYLVGVDIEPGVWRSTGTAEDCYWETTTKTGDLIQNHFGMSGGTAYIPASAFQVRFEDCGMWVFISPP